MPEKHWLKCTKGHTYESLFLDTGHDLLDSVDRGAVMVKAILIVSFVYALIAAIFWMYLS